MFFMSCENFQDFPELGQKVKILKMFVNQQTGKKIGLGQSRISIFQQKVVSGKFLTSFNNERLIYDTYVRDPCNLLEGN